MPARDGCADEALIACAEEAPVVVGTCTIANGWLGASGSYLYSSIYSSCRNHLRVCIGSYAPQVVGLLRKGVGIDDWNESWMRDET